MQIKKILLFFITVFSLFLMISWVEATRIHYEQSWCNSTVTGYIKVHYNWEYKIVDNYGTIYKTYTYDNDCDSQCGKSNCGWTQKINFSADISDWRKYKFKVITNCESWWGARYSKAERVWKLFEYSNGNYPKNNPYVQLNSNCLSCKWNFPSWNWIKIGSSKWNSTWIFTSSFNPSACQWTCESGFEKKWNSCIKKIEKCSWTKPNSQAGKWIGSEDWKNTWTYTSGKPKSCQWTCKNGFKKQGNSCIKKIDESCSGSEFSWIDTLGCNKCIDAWRIYEWKNINYLTHSFYNKGPNDVIYYKWENSLNFEYKTLQNTTSWGHSTGDLFKYSDWFTWNSSSYHIFKAWYNEKFIELINWKWFSLNEVKQWTNRDKFAYRIAFIDYYHNKWNSIWPKLMNKECTFYKPSWCGDWIVDSNEGEQCDPKNPSSIPTWKICSATCKIVEKPVTCDKITVDPNSGNVPLDTNITCSWTNVTKGFRIEILDQFWNIVYNKNWKNADYKFNTSWNYIVKCFADKQVNSEACTKKIQVWEKKNVSIKIFKTDDNPNDRDWESKWWKVENPYNFLNSAIPWYDTQTIWKWEKSIFTITVINDWNVVLKNIKITDSLAANCSWEYKFLINWNNWTNQYYKNINLSTYEWKLNPGASFTYTCESDEILKDYTNTASVTADPVDDSLNPVTDSDDSKVIVEKINKECKKLEVEPPFIQLIGNDEWTTQVVCEWDNVKSYQILCWNGDIINSSTWTCNYDTPWDYQVVCKMDDVVWKNCNATVKVSESKNPDIKIEKYSWNDDDLDWIKTHISTDDHQKVADGAKAVFIITITNTGNEDLIDVKITDIIAPNCNKDFSELKVWKSKTYECERNNTTSGYINSATVTAKWKISGITEWVNDTDRTKVEKESWLWPNSPESIKIEKYSANEADVDWDKNHDPSDDSQKITKDSKAVFKIKVTNDWRVDLKDVVVTDENTSACNKIIWDLAINQSVVYTCELDNVLASFTNEAIVTWQNKNDNTSVSDKDTTNVVIPSEGHNGWGWGWWSSTKCLKIEPLVQNLNYSDWIDVICKASKEATTFRIYCWKDSDDKNVYITWISNMDDKLKFKWTCAYWLKDQKNIRCEVSNLWHQRYKTSPACKNKTTISSPSKHTPKCRDWILDKGEECDDWNDDDTDSCNNNCKRNPMMPIIKNEYCWDWIVWKRIFNWKEIIDECDFGNNPWLWPKWCNQYWNNKCKINLKTIPAGWELQIVFPEINKIVWMNEQLFIKKIFWTNKKVTIQNTWVRTLFFDKNKKLCLIGKNNNKNEKVIDFVWECISLSWIALQPKGFGWTYSKYFNYSWSAKTKTNLKDIFNKNFNYWDAIIIATIQTWDSLVDKDLLEAYFAKKSNIRVSRPWVSTTGAWNTKYNTNKNTVDVNVVTDWSDNNFVGWNVWNTFSKTTSSQNKEVIKKSTAKAVDVKVITKWSNSNSLPTKKYNGLNNVFVSDWDVTLQNLANITWWAKTYIINWDLTIKDDITSTENIAFIIKWWDLKISNNVKHLDWTYIVMNNNKKIKWLENKWTNDQLVVKGSLYWNINDLVSKRTYIDWDSNSDDWILDIWTLLDFDSDMYKDPAPLLSDFLTEYTNANKIAR